MSTLRTLPVLLALAAASPAFAQDPPSPAELLADVGQTPIPSRIQPAIVQVGAWSYFVADVDGSQRLYRTGGTSTTTELFFDADRNTPQRMALATAVGSRLFFFAGPTLTQRQLWVTDGSAAGTRRLLGSPTTGFRVEWARAVDDRLIFLTDQGDGLGAEPWVSDGTVAGTHLLLDLTPGPLGSIGLPEIPTVAPDRSGVGSRLWLPVWDIQSARTNIWSLDGTAAGSQLEATLDGIRVIGLPAVLGPGRLAFVNEVASGRQIVIVEQGRGATALAAPAGVTRNERGVAFDGRAFFGSAGSDLAAATDGTGVQTISLRGGVKSGSSVPLGSRANTLFLAYQTGVDSWRLAELAAGSSEGVDIGPLPGEPVTRSLPTFSDALWLGDRLVLTVSTPQGRSMFALDTTGNRPVSAVEIYRGGGVATVARHFGVVLFAAVDRPNHALWATDGTAAGTRELNDLQGTQIEPDSNLGLLTPFGEYVAFVGGSATYGRDPWITDGSRPGTARLRDLGVSRIREEIRNMIAVGDELWTLRSNPLDELELIVEAYDGRVGSSRVLHTIPFNVQIQPLRIAAAFGSSLLYYDERPNLRGTFRLDRDGTSAPVLTDGRQLEHIEVLGEQAVIINSDRLTQRRSVYLTDGTAAGTRLLGDAGTYRRDHISVARFQDRVWFSVEDGTYVVDAQGVAQFAALPGDVTLTAAGDRLFAYSSSGLLVTDGTAAGTVTLLAATALADPGRLLPAALGDRLLFVLGTGTAARPWISDGTAAGTRQLADVPMGHTEFWVTSPDRALFPGTNPATGARAVFVTDGTSAGTRWLEDLAIPDQPRQLGIAHAGKVVVLVDDPQLGEEPHVIDARFGVDTRGAPCAGSGFATATLRTRGAPRLGRTVRLQARGAGAGIGWFLLGSVTSRPVALPGSRCGTEVDLLSAVVTGGLSVGANGLLETPLTIPGVPALAGLRIATQALLATGQGPLGIDVTPTVVLGIGR